jgi:hypothetical protein
VKLGGGPKTAGTPDFSKYGKSAGQMKAAYEAGSFLPPDFNSSANTTVSQGSTISAEESPYIKEQMDRYRERFNVDNTKRAIDKSNLGIADAAALGAKDLRANTSRRGIHGTDAGSQFLQKNVFDPAQRAAAKAASDIVLQRERDLDALTLGGTGLMMAQDQVNLANRQFGLQARESDRADERFRRQMEEDEMRRREEAARWAAMTNAIDDDYSPVPKPRRRAGGFGA